MQPEQDTYYIGIDGGGSNCRARLTDSRGRILGEGRSGSANFRLGVTQVRKAILSCCEDALKQAGMQTTTQQLHAGIGLAGAVLEGDAEIARPITSLFASCRLKTDAYIACLGAHQGQAGAILILGTGSCAQLISPQETRTLGGWGFTLGDQGSGAWLGHQAIRLALQAVEGIVTASPLTQAISQQFDGQPGRFLAWSLEAKPADFARFAPLVFQHAQQHDAHALNLLSQASSDICRLLEILEHYQTGRIALLGGLADAISAWLPEDVRTRLVKAQGDALDGALLLARQQADQE